MVGPIRSAQDNPRRLVYCPECQYHYYEDAEKRWAECPECGEAFEPSRYAIGGPPRR